MFKTLKDNLFSKSIPYGIGNLLPKLYSIITIPIITRHISPDDYGILQTFQASGAVICALGSLSLSSAFFRFYYEHNEDKQELKSFISTHILGSLFSHLLLCGLGLLLLAAFAIVPAMTSNTGMFTIILFNLTLANVSSLSILYQKINLQATRVAFFKFIFLTLSTVLLVVFLTVFNLSLWAPILSGFIAGSAEVIFLIYLLKRLSLFSMTFDIKLFIKSLKFSAPLLPSEISGWISNMSDRVLISKFRGVYETGIYSMGYQIGFLAKTVSYSFSEVFNPILMKQLLRGEKKLFETDYPKFFTLYFILLLLVCFGLSLFGPEIINILTTARYHNSSKFVALVANGYFFHGLYLPFATIISYYKKTYLISASAFISAGVNLLLNITLIPQFGAVAAAISTLICFLTTFLLYAFWSLRLVKIRLPYLFYSACWTYCLLLSLYFSYFYVSQTLLFTLLHKSFAYAGIFLIFLSNKTIRNQVKLMLDLIKSKQKGKKTP